MCVYIVPHRPEVGIRHGMVERRRRRRVLMVLQVRRVVRRDVMRRKVMRREVMRREVMRREMVGVFPVLALAQRAQRHRHVCHFVTGPSLLQIDGHASDVNARICSFGFFFAASAWRRFDFGGSFGFFTLIVHWPVALPLNALVK